MSYLLPLILLFSLLLAMVAPLFGGGVDSTDPEWSAGRLLRSNR